jgi:hypothetical protein
VHRNARRGSGRAVRSAIIGPVILIQALGGVKRRWRQAEGEGGAAGHVRLSDDGGGGGRGWAWRPMDRGKAEMREDLLYNGQIRNGGDQA